MAMRMHITLDDALIDELDRRVGPRGRSSFIAGAVREALDDERRWELIESALGSVEGVGHEWDDNPAEWVRRQRNADSSRVG
jgi:metal-responsive CopG/Arc/MetJ family transcriptional regulator